MTNQPLRENNWQYKGKDVLDTDIPTKSIGFIYLITQISTGKKYIGRKILESTTTKVVNGKRKKIKKDSGWRSYWSSSPKIKEWIESDGTDDFKKEILSFVSSKGQLAYGEEMALHILGALESDNFLNDNIRSKIYRSWVKREESAQLREILKGLV
jgi:hypothetical protein